MRNLKFFICFIISVLMYLLAPKEIDYTYSLLSALLFLVQSFWTLRADIKRDGLLCFNSLFLLSFFLVTYAYPLIVIGTPLQSLFVGIFDYIDYSISTKCTALCTMAISAYFVAYETQRRHLVDFPKWIKINGLSGIKPVHLIIYAALLLKTIVYMRDVNDIAVDSGFWEVLYEASLTVYLIHNCKSYKCSTFRDFVRANTLPLVLCFIIMFLYLVLGDRGIIITCGVILVSTYWYFVGHIRTWFLISGMIAGVFLMFIIQQTRTTDTSLSSGNTSGFIKSAEDAVSGTSSSIMLFSDFLIIHRELYLGYEYYQKYGVSYPSQVFILPFYPLPFIPTLIAQTAYGHTMNEIKPGAILEDYISYTGYGHLGIHSVSDALMRFGHIGLLIVFYLWGYIVSRITASKKSGILGFSLFIILLSQAIYVPRAPIVDQLKILADVIILIWISATISRKSKRLDISVI